MQKKNGMLKSDAATWLIYFISFEDPTQSGSGLHYLSWLWESLEAVGNLTYIFELGL